MIDKDTKKEGQYTMKRRLLAAVLIALTAACGVVQGAFTTNTTTATVNLDHLSNDFGDFYWQWNGYEDIAATLTVTNDSGGVTLTSTYGIFKMTSRVGEDEQVAYITKNVDDVTIGTATMGITVSKSTLETIPNGVYNAQFLWTDATTNVTRNVGRGQIRVTDSLFDDDDDTFSASTITNLTDYLTIVAAAATYVELAGDTMTGDLNGGGNSLDTWATTDINGSGITNVDHGSGLSGLTDDDHTQYLLTNGTRAMGANLNMGGYSISNIADASMTGALTISNTLAPLYLRATSDAAYIAFQTYASTGLWWAAGVDNTDGEFKIQPSSTSVGDDGIGIDRDGTLTVASNLVVGGSISGDGSLLTGIPASAITEADPNWAAVSNTVTTGAANGQTAYGWGDHATNDYLYTTGDTMTGPLLTTLGHLTNAPASDE